MAGPWEKYAQQPVPQAMTVGAPDPYKAQQRQQEMAIAPLERQSKQINIEQGQQALGNTTFNQKDKLRSDYQALPQTKTYTEFLPALFKAVQAPDNAQGDLAVLYAFSKAMDPTTGVREGEQGMARATASLSEQAQVWLNRVSQGERLPPQVRHQFVETMRETGKQYAHGYGQQRQFYTDLAKRNNFDPAEIVGPDAYAPFMAAESEYIRAHGGTPKIDGVPVAPQVAPQGDIGFNQPADPSQLSPEQQAKDQAFLATNPSPEQYAAFLQAITGGPVDAAAAAERLKAAQAGGTYSGDVVPPQDPRVQQRADEMLQTGGDGLDAGTAGAMDTLTMGYLDEAGGAVNALAGSLQGKGSFSDLYGVERDANRQYLDALQGNHPIAFGAGQVAGGLVLPSFGASSATGLARLGAGYGGAYGMGSADGSMSDRLAGGVEGAAVGAGVGAVAGKMFTRKPPRDVPGLVGADGRLNEPLEAAGPAARVAAGRQFGIDLPMGAAGDRSAAMIEKGLDNLPGSAGIMNDSRRVVEGQVSNAVEGVAGKFGSSRTLNEAGGELQSSAKGWMTRLDQTTSKAYDAIPISPDAPTNLGNTTATLEQLAGKLESNPDLAEEIKDPALLRYLDAINKNGLSWKDLKDFRTFVGNKIGQFRFSEDARTGDYRALYAALSEDMRNSAAAQGPHALRAFNRANSINAQGQRRIEEALVRIVGPDSKASPEKAAAAIQAMTRGGKSTGDLKTLAQIKASTEKGGGWDEIAATLIRMGGQPANSPGRSFDPGTFVRWYSDMAEPARGMLFKPELRKHLDAFVAVNQRLSGSNALRNTSNTAPVIASLGTVGAAGFAAMNPLLGLKLAGAAAANFGMAKLWTSPRFVQWATGYSRAMASGNQNAVRSQVGRLAKIATTNPELRAPIEQLLRSVANDNAKVVSGAAAGGADPNGNQQ